jgi:hypothetical protein
LLPVAELEKQAELDNQHLPEQLAHQRSANRKSASESEAKSMSSWVNSGCRSARSLVPEAAGNLVIAVKTADHHSCLNIWGDWARHKTCGLNPAGHQ